MTGHVRKRQTAKGVSWQVVLDEGEDGNGKRKRQYLTVNGTKKDAMNVLNEKLNDSQKGLFVEISKITTEEYLRQWMETYVKPNLSPSTARGYKVNMENHIIPILGTTLLQKLNPMMIQNLINVLVAKKLSPRTVKYIQSTLREALQQAFKMQIIPRNFCDFVSLPRQVRFKATSYSEEEAIALLQKAKDTEMEPILAIALALGTRRGEMLALRWSDIDFSKNNVSISRNLVYVDGKFYDRTTKTAAGVRTVAMPAGLAAILKKHRKNQLEQKLFFGDQYQENDLVCCNPDGSRILPGTLSHRFDHFLKEHGLRHIRLHDLRHSNISLLGYYGVPIKVISERIGHSSTNITLDTYTHLIGSMQTDAAEKIDTIFQKVSNS